MIRSTLYFAAIVMLMTTAHAQPPQDRPRQPDNPSRNGPPGFLIMTALDADGDGKISTREIENAVAALQTLDKNKDGRLSQEEIGWSPPEMRGGRGFRSGPPGGGEIPGGRPPEPQPSNYKPTRTFFSVKQLQRLDRNQDNQITTDEIPKALQKLILGRADHNEDGVIDRSELAELAKTQEQEKKQKTPK